MISKKQARKMFPNINRRRWPWKPGGFIWKIDYWFYMRRRNREIGKKR